jgi:hypothetical protein
VVFFVPFHIANFKFIKHHQILQGIIQCNLSHGITSKKKHVQNEHVEMKNANLKRKQQQLRWWIMDIKAGKKQNDKPLYQNPMFWK